jgi:anti-sigma-K factor RskA
MSPVTPPASPDPDELDHLAGEYVRGALSQSTRDAIARRMAAEPALAERVRYWEQRLSPSAAETDTVQPVPAPRTSGVESAGAPPASQPDPSSDTSWWNSLPLWRALAFAGIACALALALLVISGGR